MDIECKTQAELEVCCTAGNRAIVRSGYFEATAASQVTACGSSQVRACDSSQVTAYGSSQVRACGSSQVTAYGASQVTAYDSSQVTAYGSSQVTAYDSSQVTAYGSSQVTAYGASQVTATGNVFIRLLSALKITASLSVVILAHTHERVIEGGQILWAQTPETPQQWCDLHGVELRDGVAILYKALNNDFTSLHGTSYAPGTEPIAQDWDGGEKECGGGLHFSPTPAQAVTFHPEAQRFALCCVRLSDMRAPKAGDQYPEKTKAQGCCAPCVECDIHGNLITEKVPV